MAELLYMRVTEDKTSIILEDRDGNELNRYVNADDLMKAVSTLYGPGTLVEPRKQ